MLGAAIHVDAISSDFDGQSPQNLDIQWDFGDVDDAKAIADELRDVQDYLVSDADCAALLPGAIQHLDALQNYESQHAPSWDGLKDLASQLDAGLLDLGKHMKLE
jgi:hypothetical protein